MNGILNDINKWSTWVISFWLITSVIAGAKVYSESGGLVPFLPISNTQQNEQPTNNNHNGGGSNSPNNLDSIPTTIL